MKAVIFEKQGLDYLQVKGDVELPTITGYDVLIKVRSAGVNPIDYFTVSSAAGIKPLPHIPGAVCLAISGGCCMFVRHNICTIFILFDYRDRLCAVSLAFGSESKPANVTLTTLSCSILICRV